MTPLASYPGVGGCGPILLTSAEHILSNVVEVVDLCLFWSVDYDDSGAKDTQEAAHLAMQIEPLLQQLGGQHSTAGRENRVTVMTKIHPPSFRWRECKGWTRT